MLLIVMLIAIIKFLLYVNVGVDLDSLCTRQQQTFFVKGQITDISALWARVPCFHSFSALPSWQEWPQSAMDTEVEFHTTLPCHENFLIFSQLVKNVKTTLGLGALQKQTVGWM